MLWYGLRESRPEVRQAAVRLLEGWFTGAEGAGGDPEKLLKSLGAQQDAGVLAPHSPSSFLACGCPLMRYGHVVLTAILCSADLCTLCLAALAEAKAWEPQVRLPQTVYLTRLSSILIPQCTCCPLAVTITEIPYNSFAGLPAGGRGERQQPVRPCPQPRARSRPRPFGARGAAHARAGLRVGLRSACSRP